MQVDTMQVDTMQVDTMQVHTMQVHTMQPAPVHLPRLGDKGRDHFGPIGRQGGKPVRGVS